MKSKKDIIKLLAIHKNDVGSTEVQIGILSEKIERLASSFYFQICTIFVILSPGGG